MPGLNLIKRECQPAAIQGHSTQQAALQPFKRVKVRENQERQKDCAGLKDAMDWTGSWRREGSSAGKMVLEQLVKFNNGLDITNQPLM